MSELLISRSGVERIPELEDLWNGMHAHHASMQTEVAPTRAAQDSWRRRREQYERWLIASDTLLLIAERDQRVVGYAMVRFMSGPATWDVGGRVAEVESLVVDAEERSRGIGAELIAAARAQAREAGAERLMVGVAHANAGALRFYEREGFAPFYVLLMDGG